MTASQAYKSGEAKLAGAGIENARNESLWIFQSVTGNTLSHILAFGDEETGEKEYELFMRKIDERVSGRPLQYILGKWEFYGMEYYVGEGVLIPRPETEMLVDFALDYLKDKAGPVVIDLCAGTGCIGLTVAKLIPGSKVYLAEKYDEAFEALRKNAQGVENAVIMQGDIFDESFVSSLPACDLLLSNPPYIRSGEISSLQSEVLREPRSALDGGEDGLVFYRALADIYSKICRGAAILECGEDQGEALGEIFPGCIIRKDSYGNDRSVIIQGENG